jgi:hypothetical protein
MGFKNRVVDAAAICHMLSGGREMAGKKEEYLVNNSKTYAEWMARCPALNTLCQTFLKKL